MIKFKDLKKGIVFVSSGCCSVGYYRLRGSHKLGFKALHSIDNAIHEFNTHKKAYKQARDMIPKPHYLAIANIDGEYTPGFVMQHIDGITLDEYNYDDDGNIIDLFQVERKLTRNGITHNDLHECNVLIDKKGKVYVIDWDDRYISFSPKRRKKVRKKRGKV